MAHPVSSLDALRADLLLLAYQSLLHAIEALRLASRCPVVPLVDTAAFQQTLATLTAEAAQLHAEEAP